MNTKISNTERAILLNLHVSWQATVEQAAEVISLIELDDGTKLFDDVNKDFRKRYPITTLMLIESAMDANFVKKNWLHSFI